MFKNVLVVGVGGTGSKIVMPLAQIMKGNYRQFRPKVWLVDADNLSRGNGARQDFLEFEVESPKADALRRRFSTTIPVDSLVMMVNAANVNQMFTSVDSSHSDPILVIASVDNIETRVLLLNWLQNNHKGDWLWISPGNTELSGQVIAYGKINGELTNPQTPQQIFQDYGAARADGPDQLGNGCGISTDGSGTQSMMANQLAATLTIQQLINLLERKVLSFVTYFEINGTTGEISIRQQTPAQLSLPETGTVRFRIVEHEGYTEAIFE